MKCLVQELAKRGGLQCRPKLSQCLIPLESFHKRSQQPRPLWFFFAQLWKRSLVYSGNPQWKGSARLFEFPPKIVPSQLGLWMVNLSPLPRSSEHVKAGYFIDSTHFRPAFLFSLPASAIRFSHRRDKKGGWRVFRRSRSAVTSDCSQPWCPPTDGSFVLFACFSENLNTRQCSWFF